MNKDIMKPEEELFTQQVLEGWTVKQLQEFYGLGRSQIYVYKRKWDLSGKTPNSKPRCQDSGVKICGICKQEKSLDNFYSNGYYPSGTKKYKPNCKPCEQSKTNDNWLDFIEECLTEINKKLECENCGYNKNYAALNFHHRNPSEKDFSLSEISKTTRKNVKEEISKCDILCANCHAEEHHPHLNIQLDD